MKRYFSAIIVLAFCCSPAYASVKCGASCEGDSVTVSVSIVDGTQYPGMSIVVRASMVGSCDDVSIVSPTPYPISEVDLEQVFSFKFQPADLNRIYFYEAMLMDESGNLSIPDTFPLYRNGNYLSCGEGIAARGTLEDPFPEIPGLLDPHVDPCDDQCWVGCGDNIHYYLVESEWDLYVNTDQVVDVYARIFIPFTIMTMPGTPCMLIERIEPVSDPAGCDAVANESTSWGSLKSMYR